MISYLGWFSVCSFLFIFFTARGRHPFVYHLYFIIYYPWLFLIPLVIPTYPHFSLPSVLGMYTAPRHLKAVLIKRDIRNWPACRRSFNFSFARFLPPARRLICQFSIHSKVNRPWTSTSRSLENERYNKFHPVLAHMKYSSNLCWPVRGLSRALLSGLCLFLLTAMHCGWPMTAVSS